MGWAARTKQKLYEPEAGKRKMCCLRCHKFMVVEVVEGEMPPDFIPTHNLGNSPFPCTPATDEPRERRRSPSAGVTLAMAATLALGGLEIPIASAGPNRFRKRRR